MSGNDQEPHLTGAGEEPRGTGKSREGSRVIDFTTALEGLRSLGGSMKGGAMFPERDDEGFLMQPEMWTRSVGESIARDVLPGELSEDHWKVIDYLRDYYSQYNAVPPVRILAQRTGIDAPYLRTLFPCGLTNGACKIAGFPRAAVRGLLYP